MRILQLQKQRWDSGLTYFRNIVREQNTTYHPDSLKEKTQDHIYTPAEKCVDKGNTQLMRFSKKEFLSV